MLRVTGVGKTFAGKATALRDVTFTLEKGRTLAIVGVSGSGKSTLARCIAGYFPPGTGEILVEGQALTRRSRWQVQLIPQQPAASLNPRFTAEEVVAEPLVIQGVPAGDRARAALTEVGLDPKRASAPALAFSGGERQRLAIARAMIVDPKVLILDESLSGADAPLQEQLCCLLRGAQERTGVCLILISHDMALAAAFADELLVIDAGMVVEQGIPREVLATPQHPVTRELVRCSLALGAA